MGSPDAGACPREFAVCDSPGLSGGSGDTTGAEGQGARQRLLEVHAAQANICGHACDMSSDEVCRALDQGFQVFEMGSKGPDAGRFPMSTNFGQVGGGLERGVFLPGMTNVRRRRADYQLVSVHPLSCRRFSRC